ncbi:ATP-dependent 6-phosphofructokinase [Planctomycetota bacterium]|nr:ATP-dependent 6-phosphofructokinase [Planctomycetota bacterium]
MKIGVLTGGSDAPGLNAVLRAVVRTAIHRYGMDVMGVGRGFEGLLSPPELWPLSPGDMRGFERRGGTILGTCNRGSPFRAGGEDRSAEVGESLRWLGLDGLICIGGDGSLAIASRLADMGVPLVGVPKTVENDICGTGVTFGFSTAVETATFAIDKLQTASENHHQVMYLEVTGRHSGWVALSAGIAGGADAILIPEVGVRYEVLNEMIERRTGQGKECTVVVVAEGVREAGHDEPLYKRADVQALGGAATHVAAQVRALAEGNGVQHRVTVLGHLQRGGDPNPHDRVLATRFGAAAVAAVHDGHFGTMVAIQGNAMNQVPLTDTVGKKNTVGTDNALVWTAQSLGVSLGERPEAL